MGSCWIWFPSCHNTVIWHGIEGGDPSAMLKLMEGRDKPATFVDPICFSFGMKCIVGPWTILMVSHKSLNYEKCHLGPKKSLKYNKCIYVTSPK